MLKLTVAVLALALAGTASAAGWRSLRVDGSSDDAFAQSLAAFKDKLRWERRHVFGAALKDIWVQGTKAAEAEQREYTASEYYRQLDGLSYKQVVTLTDPTGATAKMRYRTAVNQYAYAARPPPSLARNSPWPVPAPPNGPYGEQVTGIVDTGPVYQHQQMTMGQR